MEKKIEDYMYLYAHSPMWVTRYTPREFKCLEMIPEIEQALEYDRDPAGLDPWEYRDRYKLLLRPLSDMTEEESEKYAIKAKLDIMDNFGGMPLPTYNIGFQVFHELLKDGFDLFGLIDFGLALNKTKTI